MIPRWLRTKLSGWCLPLLLSTIRCYAIVLSDSKIYQLIEVIWADKVEALPELGIETAVETIPLLGITISMIAHVLAQVVEDLCVLQHRAGSLC